MTIRVVLVDDHKLVRLGFLTLLEGTDINVVGEASTGAEAIRMVKELKPDVTVLDVQLPDMDGLKVLNTLRNDFPDSPVVMISAFDNPASVARAVALEAAAYLIKTADRDQIVETLRRAASGENAWSREELRRVTGALTTPRVSSDVEVPLTHREYEVLKQLATGLTNKEIASELHISYETVKEHVQHILRKVGVSDRTQAAVWAVRKGLV